MPNSLVEKLKGNLINWLLPEELFDYAERRRLESMARYHDYVEGFQRKNLRVKVGKPDDNIALNLVKTVVDDSVAMLFGQEIHGNNKQVELSIDDKKQDKIIQKIWEKNGGTIFLFEMADFGSMYGTCYVKILPDYYGPNLHRLINLDPFLMRINTNPDDIGEIWQYVNRYNIVRYVGNKKIEIAKKEITSVVLDEEGMPESWTIEYLESKFASGGRWERTQEPETWDYPFPPILHWKNLVRAGSVYGRSDLSGNTIALQDRINFVASNVSKIIRNHANPKTWARGTTAGPKKGSWGMDEMLLFPDIEARVENLEMDSDLGSSARYTKDLREVFFNITRTTDIAGLQDKIGYITNFALRVFYSDSLKKMAEKRMLYEKALIELNRRLLILSDIKEPVKTKISWPEPLPVDQKHQAETFQMDSDLGVVSKKTIAKERGYDWKLEKKELENEEKENGDLGTYLIENFSKDVNRANKRERVAPTSPEDAGRNR